MILNHEQLNANKVIDERGCWIWQGATNESNYGVVHWYGKATNVHRLSLAMTTGLMPRGHQACHTCNNPICYNPDHLYWGTHEDNLADKVGTKYFGGNCRRGHPQSEHVKGKAKSCTACAKLFYLAKRVGEGKPLSRINKITLRELNIPEEGEGFEIFLKEYS